MYMYTQSIAICYVIERMLVYHLTFSKWHDVTML